MKNKNEAKIEILNENENEENSKNKKNVYSKQGSICLSYSNSVRSFERENLDTCK